MLERDAKNILSQLLSAQIDNAYEAAAKRAAADARHGGYGFMLAGKRIDPREVFLKPDDDE